MSEAVLERNEPAYNKIQRFGAGVLTALVLATGVVAPARAETTNRVEPLPGTVSITFDDGPNHNTLRVLDLLDEYDVKGTWFILGAAVEGNYMHLDRNGKVLGTMTGEEILQEIYNRGHSLQIHDWNHSVLFPSLSEARLKSNMTRTNQKILNAIGREATCVRPPEYRINQRARDVVEGLGFDVILGDVASDDYADVGYAWVTRKLNEVQGPGREITFHEHGLTPSKLLALEEFIIRMHGQDIGFSTICANPITNRPHLRSDPDRPGEVYRVTGSNIAR